MLRCVCADDQSEHSPRRPPAGHKPARGRADRISDPKIKTSIEIIIRTPYSGQVRETNGVDPPNIPMLFAGCGPTGFFLMVGWYYTYRTEQAFQMCVWTYQLLFLRLAFMGAVLRSRQPSLADYCLHCFMVRTFVVLYLIRIWFAL